METDTESSSTALHRISIYAERDSFEALQKQNVSLHNLFDTDVLTPTDDKKAPPTETKSPPRSRSNSNAAVRVNMKPLFVQIGFGIDHDGNVTSASIRAFRDAVERGGVPSSCPSTNEIKEGEKIATVVELGVPNPSSVSLKKFANSTKALFSSCTFLGGGGVPAEMSILEPIRVVAGGLQASSFASSGSACDSASSRPKTCCAVAMVTTVLLQESGNCPTSTCDDVTSESMGSHSKNKIPSSPRSPSPPSTREPQSPTKNLDLDPLAELSQELESKNEEIRLLQEVSRLRFSQLKQKYDSLEEEHERVVCEKIRQLDLYRKRLQLRDEVVKTLTEDCNGLQEALRAKLDEEEQEDEEKESLMEVGKMFEEHEKNIEMIAHQHHQPLPSQENVQIPAQARVQMPQKLQVGMPAQVTLTETRIKSPSSPSTEQKIDEVGRNDGKSTSTDASLVVDLVSPKEHRHHFQHKKHNLKKNVTASASSSKRKSAIKGAKNAAVKHKLGNRHLPTKRNKLHLHLSVPKKKGSLPPATLASKTGNVNNSNNTIDDGSITRKNHCLPSTSSSPLSNSRPDELAFVPDVPKSSDNSDDVEATPCTVINDSQHATVVPPDNQLPPVKKTSKKLNSSSSSKKKSKSYAVYQEKNALTYEDYAKELPTKEEKVKLRSVIEMKRNMSMNVKNYRNDVDTSAAAAEVASGGDGEKGNTNDSNNNSTPPALILPPYNIDKTFSCAHWFPLKLHIALDLIEAEGHSDIISWQPHGRAILIKDQRRFVSTVMPVYFKQTKISSFQRQLNLYGFQRITKSNDRGAYWHEKFLRGMPHLCLRMKRHRVKGNRVRGASNPNLEPHFCTMPPLRCNTSTPPRPALPPSKSSISSLSSSTRFEVDL